MDKAAELKPAQQLLHQLRVTLRRYSFDELRTKAPEELVRLVPTARLLIRPIALPVDSLQRGYLTLPGHGSCYVEYHIGPPEPLQLIVTDLPAAAAQRAQLELFMQQLLHTLKSVGYHQELRWLALRDWLTGLPGQQALERAIGAAVSQPLLLALIEPADNPKEGADRAALGRRRFARLLRSELLEGEQAFWLETGRFALLVTADQQQRYLDFLNWQAPEAKQAWVGLAEAPGAEVLKLAEARLLGQHGAVRQPAGPEERGHRLRVLAGSGIVLELARSQFDDLRFSRPLSLILDSPVGFALEVLPRTVGSSLVVTGSRSRGYLLDLLALNPQGLILEPGSLSKLRAQLQRVANGEQVYEGPLVRDDLLPRERHVWRLSAQGFDNARIARQLGVSAKTVANYLSALQLKLAVDSHTELVLAYWTSTDG